MSNPEQRLRVKVLLIKGIGEQAEAHLMPWPFGDREIQIVSASKVAQDTQIPVDDLSGRELVAVLTPDGDLDHFEK